MIHNMIKKGVWIADKKGTYVIDDMEDRYVIIRDVMRDRKGAIYYGKKRFIGIDDLDKYAVV